MPLKTIYWQDGACKIIDQTLLPIRFEVVDITSAEQMHEAIQVLRVRGAPAIGIAAAFGLYLSVKDSTATTSMEFAQEVEKAASYLATSRPTAVNLFWALNRIRRVVAGHLEDRPEELKTRILDEAQTMVEEDNRVCRSIGEHGATLIKDEGSVLTHCNAGGLATASYGTALAPVYVAKEQGKRVKVFADETRPLLQGARLTTWELMQNRIDVTLICDNMAAWVMAKGWIDMVIVGTDRVALNGDFANKIGTYGVALLANAHHIPFYVAAPFSSIDCEIAQGSDIPIEERDPEEVACGFGKRTAPKEARIYNPAFDVTPARYVSGFITEKGVLQPPFTTYAESRHGLARG